MACGPLEHDRIPDKLVQMQNFVQHGFNLAGETREGALRDSAALRRWLRVLSGHNQSLG